MRLALLSLVTLPLLSAEPLPLATGNQWTYRGPNNATRQINVGLPLSAAGQIYYRVSGYAAQPLWLRSDAAGVYFYDEETARDRELLRFATGPVLTSISGCEQSAQAQRERSNYEGPSGRYNAALEVRYLPLACRDVGYEADTYLDNIGLARRVESSIAGPRTWELVHAKVGTLTIEPGPKTTLSLSLDKPVVTAGAGEPIPIKATLRLSVAEGAALRLHFTSSQRYDLSVRDSNGVVFHTWSATALFLAVTATEDFTGTRTWTIDTTVNSLPPGLYQVEAWITSNSQRQLTVATPLQVLAGN